MITDISKKMIITALLFGSLCNKTQSMTSDNQSTHAQEEKTSNFKNYLHWAGALGLGAVTFYAAYNYPTTAQKTANSTALDKAAAWLGPKIMAIPKWAEDKDNKAAIQATTAVILLARYGKSAINNFVDGLRYHNIKQPFPNPWLCVPADKTEKKHHSKRG